MGKSAIASSSSSSSTIDSIDDNNNNNPFLSSASSSVSRPPNTKRSPLSTDLILGPSTSATDSPRARRSGPPSINPELRNTPAADPDDRSQAGNFFVKVYMEGISVGRKLDLLAVNGYHGLVTALSHMFKTRITCSDPHGGYGGSDHFGEHHNYTLIYEDEDGDWMMVGDVPWQMFLTTVKRLKIARGDRC